ncbi:helix-turn-helix domain-containing protein [Anaerotruncus rubiinfantis]|uniref:helix-turn-helix domain-containing protein n=1 Tax=Anaerotruncus rubiinfantis TaxID=1720200 RepID=UPI001896E819|nr:helix-turn-helix transcriptional regulator [Anaerotruncus rubiinfantis]
MIANRIRLARQANSLSLQQLAERMTELSAPITKAALSNYETGKTALSPQAISALSSALGMPVEFFHQDDWADFDPVISTTLEPLPAARMAELKAYVQIELERYLSVIDVLNDQRRPVPYTQTRVHLDEPREIRSVCDEVRRLWGIGSYAIPSVCNLLESHDWLLFSLPYAFGHINFSGVEHSRDLRFLFYTPIPFQDEFRLLLLQELGRAYLICEPEEEAAVLSYFARELLFPKVLVEQEFGTRRSHILEEELDRAKQKYGIARRNIMLRLKELGIISESYYNNFLMYLNQNSFMRRESRISSMLCFFEDPSAYAAKVARAKAEGLLPNDFGSFFM